MKVLHTKSFSQYIHTQTLKDIVSNKTRLFPLAANQDPPPLDELAQRG